LNKKFRKEWLKALKKGMKIFLKKLSPIKELRRMIIRMILLKMKLNQKLGLFFA